jgi:GAF domain-containing protein
VSAVEPSPSPPAEEALQLVDLLETVLKLKDVGELEEQVLPGVAAITRSSSAVLYAIDPRLPAPHFLQHGLSPETASSVEDWCREQLGQPAGRADSPTLTVAAPTAPAGLGNLVLYRLLVDGECVGFLGLTAQEGSPPASPQPLERLLSLLANTVGHLAERERSQKLVSHLETYLSVSSMLCQALDLHELLETTLYCCMEAVSAEAASVLLLDDTKKSFRFYLAEGDAAPVLVDMRFPADQGLAGSVLSTQQSEIINDVRGDPRFLGDIDSKSGFQTRSMIVIPLVAGEEKIGVLEILNKSDGGSFSEDEHQLLVSVAEEIAFAIRNAKIFEYVVNSYCKQRQGQASCKGCQRPLGSWTPCAKYREAAI